MNDGGTMKPLLHNRILLLGLALSILLHGILLVIVPEGAFLSGKTQEIPPGMELRFVLRDRLSAVPAGEASLVAGEAVPDSGSADMGATGTAILSSEGKTGSGQSGRGQDHAGATFSGQQDDVGTSAPPVPGRAGYEASPEDGEDSRSVVFRRGAGRQAASGGGRPIITASTRDPVYAMYYRTLRSRIEHLGNINFPQRNGVRLYGELTVRIPVHRSGAIDDREGGVAIERSSGNAALDSAALGIVRRAAPFGPFPRSAQTAADVWVIITRLKFTRDQGHRPQIQSTVR
ncbi:MAG: TonB C-terminal domain-containing protein [Oxalobacter sp.]|nr:TonB C-terminal domain-containing protein [Oxalobacter sp.]